MIDYGNFKISLKNLEEQLGHYNSMDDNWPSWNRDGIAESVIQRFEVCWECLWKVLKRYLEEEIGLAEDIGGPKPVIRAAAKAGLLPSPTEKWFDYNQARNNTSHDYSGQKATDTLASVCDFVDDAIELYKTMAKEDWI